MVLGEAAEKKYYFLFQAVHISFCPLVKIPLFLFHSVLLLHGDCDFSYFTIVS
jgi:hypothetical protein